MLRIGRAAERWKGRENKDARVSNVAGTGDFECPDGHDCLLLFPRDWVMADGRLGKQRKVMIMGSSEVVVIITHPVDLSLDTFGQLQPQIAAIPAGKLHGDQYARGGSRG